MPPAFNDIVENSLLYRSVSQLLYWTRQSVTARLLSDERKLIALICVVFSASVVRVLLSNMQAPVKFLSFALLFVTLTALTWKFTEPFTNE